MEKDSTDSQTLILKDGRILGYAEYGDPTKIPVLGFHGMPGSRLVMKAVEQAARAAGARIIAPDRPGYGLSQPNPRGTLLDHVDDMVELADHLKLERFAVMGISGGAPYPLACAYKIPQRVTVTALISGIGPLSLPNSTHEMMQVNKIMFTVGRVSPTLAGWVLPRLVRSSLSSMEQHVQNGTSPSPDLSPDIFAIMTADQREAIRPGGSGVTFDMKILWRSWGFRFEDIRTRAYLWHGAADNLAPVRLARYVADHVPGCQAIFYPNEDHTGPLTKHIGEIMATMVKAVPSP
jgi:pimeloyl-ACP methyl ester carboxylesterase